MRITVHHIALSAAVVDRRSAGPIAASVQPAFRPSRWETGLRARADAGTLGVFAVLPGPVRKAVRVAWSAGRRRILVLYGRAVVETGTHEQLTTAGGIYRRRFTLQAAGYLEAAPPAGEPQ